MDRLLCSLTLLLSVLATAHSAAQTITPGANVQAAVAQLQPGDTLTFQGGTYPCANCLDSMPGGTSSQRITLAAAPGAIVTLKLQSSGNGINFASQNRSYITFDRLRLDASGVGAAGLKITCNGSDYSHHIRLVNVELFGAGTQGILANAGQCNASNQGGNEVIDSDIHHNGSDQQFDHGLYFASSNNLIENTKIHDNTGCGVHIYSSAGPPSASRNTVRRNQAWGHTGSCGVGILMGSGDENMAYNNLVYGNNGGIMVGNGGNNNQVYNNTVVNNRQWCLRDDNSGTKIRNTICSGNGNNGVTGGGSGAVVSDNFFSDPNFVGSGDYHLASGSSAIKAGADLSSIFTTDIEGKTRPAGKFDIGAYAVGGTGGGGTVGLPAPRNLRLLPTGRTIGWDWDGTNGPTFLIQRQIDTAPWTDVATVPAQAGSSTWTDTTLPDQAQPYTVRYRVLARQDTAASPPSPELAVSVGGAPRLPQSSVKAIAVDSFQTEFDDGRKENALDGNPMTYWHSQWSPGAPKPHPHWIVLDLGQRMTVDGLAYLPRQDDVNDRNGTITRYEVYISDDPNTWGAAVTSGTWAWPPFGEQIVRFQAVPGRYVKLQSLAEWKGKAWAAAAEVGVYAEPVTTPPATHVGTPRAVTAVQTGTVVLLTWQAPPVVTTDLAPSGYMLERRAGGTGAWGEIGRTGALGLTWTDTAVQAAQTYSYHVLAWAPHPQTGATLWSDPSAEVTVIVTGGTPGPVACVTESFDGHTLLVRCTLP